MSDLGNTIPEFGIDSLADRFHGKLSCENNKPDFKELNLGSPISPLRTRVSGGGAPATSSSSSSSGSVSGKNGNSPVVKKSNGARNSHSGEISGSSESSPNAFDTVRTVSSTRKSKPGHARSNSCGTPLIYSSGSSVNSPTVNVIPSGNIFPSGKVLKTGMACRSSTRSDILGSGTGNYGHGSIMRGIGGGKPGTDSSGNIQFSGESVMVKRAMTSLDLEEVKRVGNEQYKRENYSEALCLYDRAIVISPENAACRSNRAAALTKLGRLGEALMECEEAVRLDPGYGRAHQRLASLHLRLGQLENARIHLYFPGQKPDPSELQKLHAVERHLGRCADARMVGDWKSALRESDAAISAGADSSPQLFACRAEAFLKLHQLEDAEVGLSNVPKIEPLPISYSHTKFFGMLSEAYPFFVRAHIEMAFGRFENAVAAGEKCGQIDPHNAEVAVMLNNVKLVSRARSRGNELFNSGKFSEACSAYGEGLKYDPFNSILLCNRAACWSKLEQWERSVEDCNQALRIQPNYRKALLRRAASNGKLERWAESVIDYEVLRRKLPSDNEVSEALIHAQISLKKSHGKEVYNMKFSGEVEEVSDLDHFKALISSPGISVVHFKAASNHQCEQISTFVDETLCIRFPSVNFLKVDVEESPTVAMTENVRIVPTFKIYKNGSTVKEMTCPSNQVLEYSVRHFIL